MRDLYQEWAEEIIEYIGSNIKQDNLTETLAKKLQKDLETYIVHEWFCCDCDYNRHCNP